MTDIENERRKFEAWARDGHWSIHRNGGEQYINTATEHAWRGWIARAQVERGIPVAKLEALCDEWSQGDRAGCSPYYHEGLLDASIELRALLPNPPKEYGE